MIPQHLGIRLVEAEILRFCPGLSLDDEHEFVCEWARASIGIPWWVCLGVIGGRWEGERRVREAIY